VNILYILNFYPTKHKLVAHDEMLEMIHRGHQITVISVWGGQKEKTQDLPFRVIYLRNNIQLLYIVALLFKYPTKIISHIKLLKQYL